MDFLYQLQRLKNLWLRLPEQVKRLTFLAVVLFAVFIPARHALIPHDFGKYGHYRASALEQAAALEIRYAGQQVCYDCHDDVVEQKDGSYHKNVACEVCHGAAAAHAEEPDAVQLVAPRGRGYCTLCHEYLSSRPTGFPQIVADSHNPLKPCISCHNPHAPVPPETPKECEACHAEIARSKAVSYHVYVACTRCHEASEEHKVNPRQNPPSKPATREFCGGCHAEDADSSKEIVRVDMATHGERYVCWQCHYPHLPEAR